MGSGWLVSTSIVRFRGPYLFYKLSEFQLCCRPFCASIGPIKSGPVHEILLKKFELALKDHKPSEAWETYKDFKKLYGFPNHTLLSRFVTELSYSSECSWLLKACDVVHSVYREKSRLFHHDVLTKLSLSLARAQRPVHASTLLRMMLEKESLSFPSMGVLQLVFLHMVKTEIGTCLASNMLVQICDCFLRLTEEKSCRRNHMKPDTMIFNLVLDACVRFSSSLKGQQITELMAKTAVVADAYSIVIISRIHEMNSQRDELKKIKEHIDGVLGPFVCHYRQFYDSLLSLHFKFDDIDAAGQLVLGMCRVMDSFPAQNVKTESQKPRFVAIGPKSLRDGLKIQILPELLPKDSILRVEDTPEFVCVRNRKFIPTNRAVAKLIYGYRRHGKISEVSKLLLKYECEFHSSDGSSLCSDIIEACIHVGWLETAHDILDDMELAGSRLGSSSYVSLLSAYYKAKMFRDAEGLLKDMRKAGLMMDQPDDMVLCLCLAKSEDKSRSCINLANCLIQEMEEEKEEKKVHPSIHELNSSVYFFCKAKMIQDALLTYRKMRDMKIQPTEQTFAILVNGYSSLEMYREITILWGDIKRNIAEGVTFSRDLYELLLLNFLRGGYFERVMEVICYMDKFCMFADKRFYKYEFLKHHKNLYRSLKASDARTDAQSRRLHNVREFRMWARID